MSSLHAKFVKSCISALHQGSSLEIKGLCVIMCLIKFSIANEQQVNPYDIPYLYGSKTMSTRGRILLTKQPIDISRVTTIVAFFEENNTNEIRIQMWYGRDPENYTLDWETPVTPSGDNGRTVIALPRSEHFYALSDHRLGIYSLADPCPVLYEIAEEPQILFSQIGYEGGGPSEGDTVKFETLRLPVRFAIAVCNRTDCDVLPVPTTTSAPIATRTTWRTTRAPAQQVRQTVVVQTAEDAQFLKEDIVLGLIVWLIILSFVVFAIFFLLICLFFRPMSKKENDEGDQVGDWWVSVEDANGGLATKTAASRFQSAVATISSSQEPIATATP